MVVQISELEDAKTAAEQQSSQLQGELDEAAASAQSQAAELASTKAQIASLQEELHDMRAEVAKLEAERAANSEAQQAHEGRASEAEQRWTAQVKRCNTFSSLALPFHTLQPVLQYVLSVL